MFIPAITAPEERYEKDYYFIIKDQHVLVKRDGEGYRIPDDKDVAGLDLQGDQPHFIGLWNGYRCFTFEWIAETTLPPPLQFLPFRAAFVNFSTAGVHAISLATQILTWDRTFRFCGQCGHPTTELLDERAKVCKRCGLTNYPRLSPSIIVSVIRNDTILLARSPRFPLGMYSILAGFVEPGETLEDCIRREIREEVTIEVDNIRYFGSQNWPFPHSLMIGFTADYARGEIKIDNQEIVDAQWFTINDLPKLPGSYSIARQIIDDFITTMKG